MTVAIAAPNAPKKIIRGMFSSVFTTAPAVTVSVNALSLPRGIRYCTPMTLLMPIATQSADSITAMPFTPSYPSPKNQVLKLKITAEMPKASAVPRNQTNLDAKYMFDRSFSMLPLRYSAVLRGIMTEPRHVTTVSAIFTILSACS